MAKAITHIQVKGLFGHLDYDLPLAAADGPFPSVSLLYGDNGKGKTTILELIFHLLSTQNIRAHRSFVAKVPFEAFSIAFSDGSSLTATRPSAEILGDFSLNLHSSGTDPLTELVQVDPESTAMPRFLQPSESGPLVDAIAAFELDVTYLPAGRDLSGDRFPASDETSYYEHMARSLDAAWRREPSGRLRRSESTLSESIRRAEQWVTGEAFRASSTGETDARQSYLDILHALETTAGSPRTATSAERAQIQTELSLLQEDSSAFSQFGLVAPIDTTAFSDILTRVTDAAEPFILQVLESFLQGQQSRLNALRPIHSKLRNFVNLINSYFGGKHISFNIYDGFEIVLPDQALLADQALDPDKLSSGEKNLLLILLNVFTSPRKSSLIIIDEPELSLNIKWQRTLVESLLELGKDSHWHFIMATHSIELLTRHSDRVVVLNGEDE